MKRYFSRLIEVLAGGFRWWLPAERHGTLLGPDGLRLAEWLRAGQAHVVKRGHHRIVYRVELPGLALYLKHNLLPDLRTWLRQCIRPSKARIEFVRALAVAERGLPTAIPLALGEQRSILGVGESFLITESLEDTQSLIGFLERLGTLPAVESTRIRQIMARELGRLLGRIHQAGILHQDLHSGNILLRREADGKFSLFLIDLHSVQLGAPLSWSDSLENLAMLNRWFFFRSTRSDRLRFWHAYHAARQSAGAEWTTDPGQFKTMIRNVEEHTLESLHELCLHYERRCLKSNRHFCSLRGPGSPMRGHAVTDLDEADWRPLLADPDEPFRRPGAKLYKDSNTSTVTEMDVRVQGQVRRVIYKRFNVKGWASPLAGLFRPSPALRSWVYAQAFRQRYLNTPRPLLLLQRRRYGLDWEGYLMTEKIDGAQDLSEFLQSLTACTPGERRRIMRQRINEVALMMRDLHRWSFSNRDPKAANWLIGQTSMEINGRKSDYGIWIIDLVGIARKRKLTQKHRVKNLARLNASFHDSRLVSRTDRLRFLRTYMCWSLSGKEGWKTWWHAIDQATQAKVARNLRRQRVLT